MSKKILELKPYTVWKHFYELTQIPRSTGHTHAVQEYIVDFAESKGFRTKQDKVGNVLVLKPASESMQNAPVIILQSHTDMVPQKNSEVKHDFLKDPIQTCVVDNRVKACNTTLGADNGIGVAAMLALLDDNTLVHGPLELLFTVDEEEGMVGAFGLEAGFLSGNILLNLDTEEEGELCIGCAGGIDQNITWQYKDTENVSEGDVAIKISLTGLRGGHSGCDIHLGRANANKLMFRFLKAAVSFVEARLASVNGGSLRNAIPREAFAIVTLPSENLEELYELAEEYCDIYKQEYYGVEDNLQLALESAELPFTLIPEEIQDNLINAIEASPNGVVGMHQKFRGIVETSTNLASVESSQGKIEVKFLTRSSSETKKYALESSINSLFSMAGAKVESAADYPGWEPKNDSFVQRVMKDVYKSKYGKEPLMQVVHAGLECGIILNSFPDLDIVSFGPTILNPHSPDEYVEIDSVERFYYYLIEVLQNLKQV